MTELSDKTMVKLPIVIFVSLCSFLVAGGGMYWKMVYTTEKVVDLEKKVALNETLDREEREKIKKEESEKHEQIMQWFSKYLQDEVGGLRADWERDRQMQNKRLDKLEK
jgi:hypothetical protein